MQDTKDAKGAKDTKGARDEAERAGAWQTQAVSEKTSYLRQRKEVAGEAAPHPRQGFKGEG
jgi:hypothetical protein